MRSSAGAGGGAARAGGAIDLRPVDTSALDAAIAEATEYGVKTEAAGAYGFAVQSDDGARLWVNGQLLLNNWSDHPLTENTGTLSLPAGTWVNLRLEYYERAGSAALRLLWTPPGQAKRVIPAASLSTP